MFTIVIACLCSGHTLKWYYMYVSPLVPETDGPHLVIHSKAKLLVEKDTLLRLTGGQSFSQFPFA